ncbi:MAG: helix-turn-helix domain-containing protein, partial [Candidatus Omnitrophota bacterium]
MSKNNVSTPREIGNLFKEAREKLGLSIPDAAAQSKIHHNVLEDIENGAYERLGKLYMKSFIKKYSFFLELDTNSIAAKFDSISAEIPAKE